MQVIDEIMSELQELCMVHSGTYTYEPEYSYVAVGMFKEYLIEFMKENYGVDLQNERT